MDPYVKFSQKQIDGIKSFEYKTKVIQGGGKTPVWNETFDIPVTNCHLAIKFTIMEEDVVSDDKIGVGEFTARLFTRPQVPTSFPAIRKGSKSADLFLKAEWLGGVEHTK